MSKTLSRRAHVILPVDVVDNIDQREIKLRLQRQALRESAGAWKPEDHPELANGSAAWVRQIRSLDSRRFEELEQRRDGK